MCDIEYNIYFRKQTSQSKSFSVKVTRLSHIENYKYFSPRIKHAKSFTDLILQIFNTIVLNHAYLYLLKYFMSLCGEIYVGYPASSNFSSLIDRGGVGEGQTADDPGTALPALLNIGED